MSSRSFAGSIRANLCGLEKHCEYFPNWAEEGFTSQMQSGQPLPVELPEGFKIMFAGNLGEAQDFETILKAAELTLNKGICWLLVGSGRRFEWIQSQIRERSLGSVFLLGHHPIEMMPGFFERADAMLLSLGDNPLFRLTVPAKLQAYMASGKVVIGVLAGEGAEVLRASGGGIVVEPGNAGQLAAAVLSIRDLPQSERQMMETNSRRYYQDNFERNDRIDRLEKLLRELVRDAGRNGAGEGERKAEAGQTTLEVG
jgi:glycosyltransferase involved in cell wall biosynthesis